MRNASASPLFIIVARMVTKVKYFFAKMTKNCNLQIEKWGIFFKIRSKYDKI